MIDDGFVFLTAIVDLMCITAGDGTGFHCQAVYLVPSHCADHVRCDAWLYPRHLGVHRIGSRNQRIDPGFDDSDDAVSDVAQIQFTELKKLGVKTILLCLVSAATIVAGFVITHLLMRDFLGQESSQTFGVMAAGWTGGTQNFVAVKEALQVTDGAMSYTLLMGALCYSVWLVVVMAMKPHRRAINQKLGVETVADKSGYRVPEPEGEPIDASGLMSCLGISLLAASVSTSLGSKLASLGLSSVMLWTVILSTALGTLAAHTPLRKLPAAEEFSGVMLYIIVALIGAEVSLAAILDAPFYILSGFFILSLHGAAMIAAAKILKIDIALAAIASVANIGSAPSATVVAATFEQRLIPTAILMSLSRLTAGFIPWPAHSGSASPAGLNKRLISTHREYLQPIPSCASATSQPKAWSAACALELPITPSVGLC